VLDGTKQFDIRNNNDSGFQKGDVVVLHEFDTEIWEGGVKCGSYTGRSVTADITYVTNYEQKPGFVVFGIELTSPVIQRTINKSFGEKK